MKKQTNPNIKAHLLRGAFYLLLLVAICAIPFTLAERNTIKPVRIPAALAQTGVDALKALLKPRIPDGTCIPAWQSGPDQPPARYAFQAALGTDNMLYVAGGQTADATPTLYDQVSRYDFTTNTWSNVAPLPVPLGQGTIGASNGKIYLAGGFIGGTNVTNALRIYDIASNSWTSGANMPTSPGVEAAAGAVVNGKFYVMGGDDFTNGLNTTFIYDIATNTWTTGATLPDSRTNTYGTAYNGLIYVYGGVILPGFTTTDTLLRYDPVANSWTNLGSAGTAGLGNYGGIAPFGTGQLVIADGADSTGASTTGTHIFDISGGTFSAGPGPDRQPRRTSAGHAARWPGAGRRRLRHGEHHHQYSRTALHPMPQCNAYTYCNSDCHCDSHCHSNSYSNDDAEANAHSKAASNTCASAVIAGVNGTV